MTRKLLSLALLTCAVIARPAVAGEAASPEAELVAPVRKWIDANKGDVAAAKAGSADATSIIDELAPYEWHGAGARPKWMDDLDANAKAHGFTDSIVTIDKPLHVTITGDRGYLVIPAGYTYKENGKPLAQQGAVLTVSMQTGAAGWTMTGWAWASGT